MLRQKNRFHGHGSLKYVYQHGRAIRSKLFNIRYAYNPRRPHNRVAVVVPKKIAKAAVKRNRIRRRLFEAIRLELPQLASHHDIVINVYSPELIVIPFEVLQTELRTLLHESRLIKPATDNRARRD